MMLVPQKFLRWTITCVLFLLAIITQAQPVIHVEGAFSKKAPILAQANLRLSQALLYAKPLDNAYRPSFSLERASERPRQQKLKQRLLATLKQLRSKSKSTADIFQNIKAMPITGRMKLLTSLDGVFVVNNADPLLKAYDSLYLAMRPQTINLIGWAGNTKLLFDSHLLITDYLAKAHYQPLADKSYAYLIKVNGQAKKVPVAYWNRQTQRLAPGDTIYVPIKNGLSSSVLTRFNKEMVQFLSTQRVK